jgi:hypothetical protein
MNPDHDRLEIAHAARLPAEHTNVQCPTLWRCHWPRARGRLTHGNFAVGGIHSGLTLSGGALGASGTHVTVKINGDFSVATIETGK